jgi:phosphopantetheine--protein transferase-like protein
MNQIFRIGVDIVQLSRFSKSLKNTEFARKVFTDDELKVRDTERLAGIFAAKEAFYKAAQIKIDSWHDIEIYYIRRMPQIRFQKSGLAKKITSVSCSISHDGDYSVAFVIVTLKEKGNKKK